MEGNFAGRVESELCVAIKPCGYLEGNNIYFKVLYGYDTFNAI